MIQAKPLSSKREALYADLHRAIGHTKVEDYIIFPNQNNTILIKRELDNPYGTHYDRAYLELYEHYERSGKLKPGQKVYETSTGSAGASYAGIGKALGFECFAAMPAGGEKSREQAIRKYLQDDDHLFFTSAKDYVNGFESFTLKFLLDNRDVFFMNHSRGKGKQLSNETTLKGFENIAKEIIAEGCKVDYFIGAVGNGSSLFGVGNALSRQMPEMQVIGYEPFQSALAFDKKFPGLYERLFLIKPGTLSRHSLPGLSYQTNLEVPHLDMAIRMLGDVYLVSDQRHDKEYKQIIKTDITTELPHWDDPNLGNCEQFGRSTRAGLATIKAMMEYGARNKTFLLIAYDSIDRYDR
jgi:cysteine synthase